MFNVVAELLYVDGRTDVHDNPTLHRVPKSNCTISSI
jgi:hypothetical protein